MEDSEEVAGLDRILCPWESDAKFEGTVGQLAKEPADRLAIQDLADATSVGPATEPRQFG